MAELGNFPALTGVTPLEEEEPVSPPFGFEQNVAGQNIDVSQLRGYVDPRRALWGGFMSDMANHFLSGRRAGFGGRGTQAMFGAIQANQQLEDRERRRRMAEAQSSIAANPYKNMPQAYQTYKLAQQEGFEGDFTAFVNQNRAQQSGRPVKTFVGENGNMHYVAADGSVKDTGVKGSPPGMQIKDVGGVPYVEQTLPGGEVNTLTLDQAAQLYRTGRISEETRAETLAQKFAGADAEFELEVPKLYDSVQRQLEILDQLEEDIKAGRFNDTGYVEGRIRPLLDEQLAYLQALNIDQTLQQLQAVNLAPVTENEIALLQQLYPGVLAEPEANLGRLRAARQRLTQRRDSMERQLRYFADNQTLRGYGTQRFRTPEPERGPYGDPQGTAPAPGDDGDPVRF